VRDFIEAAAAGGDAKFVKRLDHGRRWVGFFKACAETWTDGWRRAN
jgi:hypothetical protein